MTKQKQSERARTDGDMVSRCECCRSVVPHDRLIGVHLDPARDPLTYLCISCSETLESESLRRRQSYWQLEWLREATAHTTQ